MPSAPRAAVEPREDQHDDRSWDVTHGPRKETALERFSMVLPAVTRVATNVVGGALVGGGYAMGKVGERFTGCKAVDSASFRSGVQSWMWSNGIVPSVVYEPLGEAGARAASWYGTEAAGAEDVRQAPLLVSNHTSYLDGLVLAACLGFPRVVAMAGTRKVPIVGRLMEDRHGLRLRGPVQQRLAPGHARGHRAALRLVGSGRAPDADLPGGHHQQRAGHPALPPRRLRGGRAGEARALGLHGAVGSREHDLEGHRERPEGPSSRTRSGPRSLRAPGCTRCTSACSRPTCRASRSSATRRCTPRIATRTWPPPWPAFASRCRCRSRAPGLAGEAGATLVPGAPPGGTPAGGLVEGCRRARGRRPGLQVRGRRAHAREGDEAGVLPARQEAAEGGARGAGAGLTAGGGAKTFWP
ncbi:unnamed protein product [Prorocentrum cordatum]|uniref:Phospholipid/glycerol acyltransferase domain-containing protein n=1 Tax=Prorocentrum cordatum TaxID=2364126 RepID=A0ABN9Y851_9DINO|nr:unnamed protein product [Polarella glacialis]